MRSSTTCLKYTTQDSSLTWSRFNGTLGRGEKSNSLLGPHPKLLIDPMPHSKQLTRLQHLLENLPESIPYCDLNSTHYSFSVATEEIEEYGDEASAINHWLEVIFGPCHNTGGITPIEERGPGVCAAAPFLVKCPPPNAQINLWINNLCLSVEKLYTEVGEMVGTYLLISYQRTYLEHRSLNSRLGP